RRGRRLRAGRARALAARACPLALPHGGALMPICVETAPTEGAAADARCITIGLVNNMPDAALEATERQFVALLGAAADGIAVRLLPYALPDVPRTDWGREYVTRCYSPIEELWDSGVDAIIVTGTEPRSPDLRDEP